MFCFFARLRKLEQKVESIMSALDAIIAAEAALETVVAAVVEDNAKLHADLTAALAANDPTAIQAVADKLAAQTAKLQAIVPPAPVV